MQKAQEYIQEHKERFLEELFEMLRIPSVSADPKHNEDVEKTAQFCGRKPKESRR